MDTPGNDYIPTWCRDMFVVDNYEEHGHKDESVVKPGEQVVYKSGITTDGRFVLEFSKPIKFVTMTSEETIRFVRSITHVVLTMLRNRE